MSHDRHVPLDHVVNFCEELLWKMAGGTSLLIGGFLVLVALFQPSHTEETVGSLVDIISSRDQAHLEQILVNAAPYNTLREAYYVAKGLSGLGITDANKKLVTSVCNFAGSQKHEELEDIFYVLSITSSHNCKQPVVSKDVESVLKTGLQATDTKTLYYAITSSVIAKTSFDEKAVAAALLQAVENEDTPQSYAYAFLAASVIPGIDLSALFENIEDIVAQADETPSTLYFDGGLKVTADVVNGIFALASRVNSTPTITEAQATKFANFLVTSKYTSSLSDAVYLLSAARTLSENKYVVPVAITLANAQPVSEANPNLSVRLTTLMGGVVKGFGLKVKSIEDPAGELNPRTRTMTDGGDGMTFSYPMYKDTTGPGQYKVTVSSDSKSSSPAVKLSGVELTVMVSFQVAVGNAQLSIVDKDQGVTTKSVSLKYPDTNKGSLQADQHSKVMMVFNLNKKGTNTPVTVHQAFVRLSLGAQEIFFVATPNGEKQYTFELDVAESAKDFGQLSGTYSMSLVVGDFALENPFSWDVASLELKFPGSPAESEENVTYKPKKTIDHMFRVPEKRPPRTVSSAFTILVLVPLVILVVVWLVMGVNISNITVGGLWGLLFQLGLGAILGLYFLFWTQMNMFTTLKCLAGIGVFTFLTGNRMLRNIAKARQSS